MAAAASFSSDYTTASIGWLFEAHVDLISIEVALQEWDQITFSIVWTEIVLVGDLAAGGSASGSHAITDPTHQIDCSAKAYPGLIPRDQWWWENGVGNPENVDYGQPLILGVNLIPYVLTDATSDLTVSRR